MNSEVADAVLVDGAAVLIQKGDLAKAEAILLDVRSRRPSTYELECERNGSLHIKFWDQLDFLRYVSVHESRNVTWISSAYPRACYYLAYIQGERQRYSAAIDYLREGLVMEPKNHTLLTELGFAHAHMGELDAGMTAYMDALDAAIADDQRARTLRGVGSLFIDMQRPDDAEKSLRLSLELEPGNETALHELEIVRELRAHLSSGPKRPWWRFW